MLQDVSMSNRQIFPAIVVGIDESRPKTDEVHPYGSQTRCPGNVLEVFASEIPIQAVKIALKIGNPESGPARSIEVAGIDSHAPVVVAGIIHSNSGKESFFFEFSTTVNEKKFIGGIIANVNVRAAIIVHIHENHAEPATFGLESLFERNVLERLATFVLEQGVHERLEFLRRANIPRDARNLSRATRVIRK